MTWMRQPSWQGIALFSVRKEFWRSTGLAGGVFALQMAACNRATLRPYFAYCNPVYAPHPDMYWKFELDFCQHPWDRLFAYAVFGILILGDAYLISRVWRTFRESPTSTETPIPLNELMGSQMMSDNTTSMIGLCQEGKSSPDALRRSAGVNSF